MGESRYGMDAYGAGKYQVAPYIYVDAEMSFTVTPLITRLSEGESQINVSVSFDLSMQRVLQSELSETITVGFDLTELYAGPYWVAQSPNSPSWAAQSSGSSDWVPVVVEEF